MGAGRVSLRKGTLLGVREVKEEALRAWRESAIQQILIDTICMYTRNHWHSLLLTVCLAPLSPKSLPSPTPLPHRAQEMDPGRDGIFIEHLEGTELKENILGKKYR